MAWTFALIGLALIIFSYGPSVWYWTQSQFGAYKVSFSLSQSEVQKLTTDTTVQKTDYQPAFDPKLPITNHLSIPYIGVNTDIHEATYTNYEDALKKGVWRVSDFGAPNGGGEPTILAAHRFGYLSWTNSFRRENSFYNLPKLKIGDTIEIVYQQRKYVYEVTRTAQGTEITDYSADLILYTCENLTGPDRFFVYAHLLEV